MKYIIILLLASCTTSKGIHNDSIIQRHKAMLEQDKRMKKGMINHRSKSGGKQKKSKHKRTKKYIQ